jgi:hypothetical protein
VADAVLPLAELVRLDADARRDLKRRREEKWRRERSAHAGTCRACAVELLWVLSALDDPQWMPLKEAPDETGSVAIIRDGAAQVGVVNPSADVDPGGPRYRPHAADCPGADTFRKTLPDRRRRAWRR